MLSILKLLTTIVSLPTLINISYGSTQSVS